MSQIPASCVADPRIRPYSSLLFYFSYLLSHTWVGIGAGSEPPAPAALAVVLLRPTEIGVGAPDGSAMERREPRAGNKVAGSANLLGRAAPLAVATAARVRSCCRRTCRTGSLVH